MQPTQQVICGQRVVTPLGVRPAWVHVAGSKIAKVSYVEDTPVGVPVLNAGQAWVLPGLVDTHVHINEPGRTAWEGFFTATAAAATGGITTLVDMPLNCIPATVTEHAVEEKRRAMAGQLHVDVAFWGGVVPGNTAQLPRMAALGIHGSKCFLCPSGVEEFPHVTRVDLEDAMPVMAHLGMTLLVHAELPGPLEAAKACGDPRAYSTYLASRPNAAEDDAVEMLIELSRRHRTRTHVVHLSSSSALPLLARAQTQGVPITAETCLHYLTFCAEEVPAGATHFKCAPPIRERANREALWQGLKDGVISMVVSDHSPCTPNLKRLEEGDFMAAWGGIASLQLGLPGLWTQAKARGIGMERVVEWSAAAPAALAGLAHRKGALATGLDANVVIFDDTFEHPVKKAELRFKHALSPYEERTLWGKVTLTMLRGQIVYDTKGLRTPRGEYLGVTP